MSTQCNRYLISGRVQGVFYRASAHRVARELGVNGWVRNLSDGRVECLACGRPEQLEDLLNWLKTGPDYAKVTNIEIISDVAAPSGEGFEIRPTATIE